ncbi:hypothetical protein QTN25_007294 [Entamoeba marina]
MTNVEQYGIPFDFGSITNNNIKLQDVVYNVIINGVFAIINVHHKFRNISQSVCSADFEFQLHTRCSLINVKAKTQTQTFETKLVEKDEAKEVYEEEKSKGHSTFLLQQLNKSNYQFSFGNCNPNDIIDVFIEYITFLTYSQNGILFSIPHLSSSSCLPSQWVFSGTFSHSNMISTICLNDESFNNINNTPIFEVTIPMTCNTKPIHGSIQMNSLSITDNLKYDSTNILSFYDPSLTSYRSIYIYLILSIKSNQTYSQLISSIQKVPNNCYFMLMGIDDGWITSKQTCLILQQHQYNQSIDEIVKYFKSHSIQDHIHIILITDDQQPTFYQSLSTLKQFTNTNTNTFSIISSLIDEEDIHLMLDVFFEQHVIHICTTKIQIKYDLSMFKEYYPTRLPKTIDEGILVVATSIDDTTQRDVVIEVILNGKKEILQGKEQHWKKCIMPRYQKYILPYFELRHLSTQRQTNDIKSKIVSISLESGILSKFTSFVLVVHDNQSLHDHINTDTSADIMLDVCDNLSNIDNSECVGDEGDAYLTEKDIKLSKSNEDVTLNENLAFLNKQPNLRHLLRDDNATPDFSEEDSSLSDSDTLFDSTPTFFSALSSSEEEEFDEGIEKRPLPGEEEFYGELDDDFDEERKKGLPSEEELEKEIEQAMSSEKQLLGDGLSSIVGSADAFSFYAKDMHDRRIFEGVSTPIPVAPPPPQQQQYMQIQRVVPQQFAPPPPPPPGMGGPPPSPGMGSTSQIKPKSQFFKRESQRIEPTLHPKLRSTNAPSTQQPLQPSVPNLLDQIKNDKNRRGGLEKTETSQQHQRNQKLDENKREEELLEQMLRKKGMRGQEEEYSRREEEMRRLQQQDEIEHRQKHKKSSKKEEKSKSKEQQPSRGSIFDQFRLFTRRETSSKPSPRKASQPIRQPEIVHDKKFISDLEEQTKETKTKFDVTSSSDVKLLKRPAGKKGKFGKISRSPIHEEEPSNFKSLVIKLVELSSKIHSELSCSNTSYVVLLLQQLKDELLLLRNVMELPQELNTKYISILELLDSVTFDMSLEKLSKISTEVDLFVNGLKQQPK